MAFKSDAEKSKWDKLQSLGEVPLDKIISGKAQPADIKALSDLITKQHELAGKVFDEGIEGAKATADKILDDMNKARMDSGKKPLSTRAYDRLFEQTFQNVLAESAEDIIGTIHDMLEENFKDQKEVNAKLISDAFDKIHNLAPKIKPKKDDLLAKIESLQSTSDETLAQTKDISKLKSLIADANPANVPIATTSLLGNLRSMFGKKSEDKEEFADVDEEAIFGKHKKDSTLDKILGLIGKSPKERRAAEKEKVKKAKRKALADSPFKTVTDVAKKLGVQKEADIIARIKAENEANPELAKDESVDKQISKALYANEKLRDKAVAEFDKIKEAREDEDEDKKADTWMRKIKGFFGSKEGKEKTKSGSFIKGLLGALILTLTNPQLITTITKGIEKYLNFDTISGFIKTSWDDIKSGGSSILDWVLDKLGLGTAKPTDRIDVKGKSIQDAALSLKTQFVAPNKEIAKASASELGTVISSNKPQLAKAQEYYDAYLKNAPGPTGKGYPKSDFEAAEIVQGAKKIQTRQKQYEAVAGADTKPTTAGSSVSNITDMVGPNAVTPAQTTTVAPTTSVASPAAVLANSSASTSVAPEAPIKFSNGVTFDMPTATPETPNANAGNNQANASNAVSIGSFGFLSADDTLNAINLRMWG